jgi:PAS domain S-box-containing protein
MLRRKLSIAVVLIAVLITVVTGLLASFAAVVYRKEAQLQRDRLRQSLVVKTGQLAAALALPMWNIDDTHIRNIVESGMSDREVQAIEVTAPEQRLVLVRDAQGRALEARGLPPAAGLLAEEREVLHAGERIGRLRVLATTRHVDEGLADWRRSAGVFILLLDIGLVLSLSLGLWLLLLRPVRVLDQYAAAVQAGDSAATPGPALFFGELRGLRSSVQRMVDMLDSRYRALRDSEERLTLATRAAAIGVWDWDLVQGRIVWDDEMHRIYGLAPRSFGGRMEDWAPFVSEPEMRRIDEVLQAALAGERPFAVEFRIRRADGSQRDTKSEAVIARDAAGTPVRMVGVNLDITERRAAEQEVRALNTTLEQRVQQRTAQLQAAIDEVVRARDQAEAATRAKSEFLANMSHEIRTPMNAVLGMTELALRGELSPRQRSYLTNAKSAADSLLAVINDILDFSKIEAGKLELEHRPFALQAVLGSVTAVVAQQAQDKGLQLVFTTAPAVPRHLLGDALRLEQVLINLLSNAVKFTPSGEVRLDVEPAAAAAAGAGELRLRFAVSDTGIGMTDEQRAGLFEPFTQVDTSTTRMYGGTGLGLAICRRLVGLMGGEIDVESVPGQGSCFSFSARFGLAEAPAEAPPGALTDAATEAQAHAALHGRRVLLVDDNELNQIVAAELLRDACGMQVTVAGDGLQALLELQHGQHDVVLMDVQMPGMDGFEVTQRIRQTPGLAALPVIAMTAYAMAQDRERCLAAGMNDFIAKPFEPRELFTVLTRWLQAVPPPLAPPPGAPAAAGGVSLELGLRRCLGRTELYQKIVRRFVAAQPPVPQEIAEALAAGAVEPALRAAHMLISTAGTLGASALSERARELQAALQEGDAAQRGAGLRALAAEHARVSQALHDYLATL